MKINIWKSVDPSSQVFLENKTKILILQKLREKNIGSKKLSKILKVPLWKIKMWKYRNGPLDINTLLSMINLINIPFEEIKDKIELKNGRRANKYSPSSFQVNEIIATGVGLLDGDGFIGENELYVGNTNINVIKSSLEFFTSLNLKNIKIIIYPTNVSSKKEIESIKRNLKCSNVTISKNKTKSRKPYMKVRYDGKAFINNFKKIRPVIDKEIELNRNLRLCYIKGLFAAEGYCINTTTYKRVGIKVFNNKILEKLSKWLIWEGMKPLLYKNLFTLNFNKKEEIKKFYKLGLASLHKDKEVKILKIIKAG
jgi:hypothetical protein